MPSINRLSESFWPDLHTHSAASDGALSPKELVKSAYRVGINVMAITDHDTLSGINEAKLYASELDVCLIPGVEISTGGDQEIHLLAYYASEKMQGLVDLLARMREDRNSRGQRFIERLAKLGFIITWEDLALQSGTPFNRPSLAKAMQKRGYVTTVHEAFQRYIGYGKPAYIPRLYIDTLETVTMLRDEGAMPVLAHPGIIRNQEILKTENLYKLKKHGLAGIECHHSKHSPSAKQYWDRITRDMSLFVTGGSDFHEAEDDHGPLGCIIPGWENLNKDIISILKWRQI